ncbi:MAG: excinuclease ABC subunit UvrA [Candidatus Alcyoniella australis]|nr:excinuclease ABC subunit UvrA [Candidatus Alcyoniella australis]
MSSTQIIVKGAREHNLKGIEVRIPRNSLTVITGLSGSGKSSLAFDTIYAEGQRRYVESLSAYARQFLEQLAKPDVESIEGLSPAISIEQKTTSRNPRSTVGTVTEIYDYLRLLFARVGEPHCPSCGRPISSQTVPQIVDQLMELPEGSRLHVLAPVVRGRKGEYRGDLERWLKAGFIRARIDGQTVELENPPKLDKRRKHDIDLFIDRLKVRPEALTRLTDSVETALQQAQGVVLIDVPGHGEMVFSEKFSCAKCGTSFIELEPRLFSFNNPNGACEDCGGLGTKMYFDEELIVPNPTLSVREGAIIPWEKKGSPYHWQMLEALAKHYKFDIRTSWKKLDPAVRKMLLHGSGSEEVKFFYERRGMRHFFKRPFEGVIPNMDRRYRETGSEAIREEFRRFMSVRPCPSCKGARLRPEALAVHVGGINIHQLVGLSITEARAWIDALQLDARRTEIARRLIKEIRDRLDFMLAVGLDYLTLERTSSTLSGGEGQRIRLATQIGAGLVGVLYILDEPSIGLHQRDNHRLLSTLKRLRDLGNTVIVVEHDRDTILAADHVIDMGPGAGVSGGEVVASGPPQQVIDNPNSLTGAYLRGSRSIALPQRRRQPGKRRLRLRGCSEHNLRKIDVEFPVGLFTCVTGVSGSGKSSLVNDTLHRVLAQRLFGAKQRAGAHVEVDGLAYVDKVICIDQSPIGRTPRSNPATYTGLFTPIRDLFTQLPESRMRGYKPGRFSFNVKGGRCEACQGDGIIKIEMHFLPDVYVTCEQCAGKRFNRDTLEIRYKGATIAEVLEMTVNQALHFFRAVPAINGKLETLVEVGLGYVKLGQSATTLSGGEAQRIKLAKELARRSTGRTVYILDEPTTGLHFDDINKLLAVLNRFADEGNTIVVIEHNLDVIKTADWIIDLGPEGGDRGGTIVAQGPPELVAQIAESHTGRFLAQVLERDAGTA